MHIKKLEIQGFKSFAHKNMLEFTSGIAAIVGPNGSGKSNVADAIRWVLGETSLKTLRGKRVQDVIFSGSSKKARLGFAEVNLFIDNEDGCFPVEYPEVILTRRVYQSGEGEYLLNKKKIRLADILLLLAKAGVGQRSYSVIGQGMIDQVLVSSPAERKNFFDEAVGVRQYQIKREKAYNKLLRTHENLYQAEVLIAEIEPRLRSLTRQVKKLERREEQEKKLKDLQGRFYFQRWHNINQSIVEQQQQFQKLASVKEKLEKEIQTLAEKMEAQTRGDSRAEAFRQLQKEYDQIVSERNGLLQREAVLKGRVEVGRVKAGRSDLAFLERRRDTLAQRAALLKEDLSKVTVDRQQKEQLCNEKTSKQQEVLVEFQERERKLGQAKLRFEKSDTKDVSKLKAEIARIQKLTEDFVQKIEQVASVEQLTGLKKEAKQFLQEIKSLKQELESTLLEQDPKEIIELQDSLTNFIKGRDNLVNEIHQAKIELSSLEDKEKSWQEEVERVNKEIFDIEKEIKLATAGTEEISQEQQKLATQLAKTDQRTEEVKASLAQFDQEEQAKKGQLLDLQTKIREQQKELTEQTMCLNEVSVGLAKLETKQEDLEKEAMGEIGGENLKTIQQSAVKQDKIDEEETTNGIHRLKHQLELIGGIDPTVEAEYKETNERYQFLADQTTDLKEASQSLEKVIGELDEKIKKQFYASFEKINKEFEKYFKMLFGGGKAGLVLLKDDPEAKEPVSQQESGGEVEPAEPEESEEEKPRSIKPQGKVISGIEIHATPPGKKLKNLNMLSGGEKALTSIALICAIISSNPSPFVVLDEVDAALDESNSIRFAKILKDLSHKTQFITITHNRATMHQASILYGITMGVDGVSKMLSIKMEEAEKIRNEKAVKEKEKA